MDTSETYIKMSDCPEIQEIWHSPELIGTHPSDRGFGLHYEKGFDGSFYAQRSEYDGWLAMCVDYEYETSYEPSHIWLPRQDQLQEMASISRGNIFTGLLSLREFIEKNAQYGMLDWSMEQLWLAFVMQQLHKKVWDGEKWE